MASQPLSYVTTPEAKKHDERLLDWTNLADTLCRLPSVYDRGPKGDVVNLEEALGHYDLGLEWDDTNERWVVYALESGKH
jgi:hypothetical protein